MFFEDLDPPPPLAGRRRRAKERGKAKALQSLLVQAGHLPSTILKHGSLGNTQTLHRHFCMGRVVYSNTLVVLPRWTMYQRLCCKDIVRIFNMVIS